MDKGGTSESPEQLENTSSRELHSSERKYRECIFGEEALKISPTEPYCLRRPIRRGHLNISQHYPMQQVLLNLPIISLFSCTGKGSTQIPDVVLTHWGFSFNSLSAPVRSNHIFRNKFKDPARY